MNGDKEQNILLICMSTGSLNETHFYTYGENLKYSGECQLEPGTKHVMVELAQNEKKLDKIFVLTTDEAEANLKYYQSKITKFINNDNIEYIIPEPPLPTENESEKDTKKRIQQEKKKELAKEFKETKFEETKFERANPYMESFCKEKNYADLYEIVKIQSPQKGIASKKDYNWMPEFVAQIQKLKVKGKVNLFLDMQGGARTSNFILNAVINMIQDERILLEKAYATAFDNDNNIHPIKDETYALKMFNLVSGMDEFISYGKANKFLKYFDFGKEENVSDEKKIVECINLISDAISVCDIKTFYEQLKNLIPLLNEYEEKNRPLKSTNTTSDKMQDSMESIDYIFLSVVQKLKNAYKNITWDDNKPLDSVEVMEWCLDRELYQQALTICESKMPKQIVDDGLISLVDERGLENARKQEISKKYRAESLEAYLFKNYKYKNYAKETGHDRSKALLAILEKEKNLVKSDYLNIQEFKAMIKQYFEIRDIRHKINHGNNSEQGEESGIDVKKLKRKLDNFIDTYKNIKSKKSGKEQEKGNEDKETEDMDTNSNSGNNNKRKNDITQYVLRYVVPFGFDEDGNIDSYNDIIKILENSGSNWNQDKWPEFKQNQKISYKDKTGKDCERYYGGSDIYDYLKNLYKSKGKNAIGSAWRYEEKQKKTLPIYKYYWKGIKERNIPEVEFEAHISDVGMFLLKTGIGLFWYEVKLEDMEGEDYFPSSNNLKYFQNRFKELAKKEEDIEKKEKDIDKYLSCYIGEWVDSILREEVHPFVYYYPEREIKIGQNEESKKIPDKAILYNYVVTKNERNLDNISYYLTMGYNNNYKYSDDILQKIARPFANERWYASKEGCGCYAYSMDNDNFIFHHYLPIRMRSDYFLIFIHLLQQSYSLMHMSAQIAENVSAEVGGKSKVLRDIEEKTNRFLIKNVNASVSHIGHHNEFYAYVENALKIKEDVSSLNEGVEVLEEILRGQEADKQEKRNELMQTAFSILTILGIMGLPGTLKDFFHVGNGEVAKKHVSCKKWIDEVCRVGEVEAESVWEALIEWLKKIAASWMGEVSHVGEVESVREALPIEWLEKFTTSYVDEWSIYIFTVIVLVVVVFASAPILAKWVWGIFKMLKTLIENILKIIKTAICIVFKIPVKKKIIEKGKKKWQRTVSYIKWRWRGTKIYNFGKKIDNCWKKKQKTEIKES